MKRESLSQRLRAWPLSKQSPCSHLLINRLQAESFGLLRVLLPPFPLAPVC